MLSTFNLGACGCSARSSGAATAAAHARTSIALVTTVDLLDIGASRVNNCNRPAIHASDETGRVALSDMRLAAI